MSSIEDLFDESSDSGKIALNGDYDSEEDEHIVDTKLQTMTPRARMTPDDFVLLKVIGTGSFGKVLLVRKKDNNKLFAMKILDKARVIRMKQVEHTRTERSVMSYANHPYIVRLRFAFTTKDKLYLVMDFMSGGELFFHLGRLGLFKETTAKIYAAELVLALGYLHSVGVVYRDIKPENILLDADGHVQLSDFGTSKEGICDNVSALSFCGTPQYLAPEIVMRSGHGRAADWWSLGAVLFEMITGMPPFTSRNRKKLFYKILHAKIRFPKHVSPEAMSLLSGLLHRDPSLRLGGGVTDCKEIRMHPFFADIDWHLLYQRKIPSPFRPDQTKLENNASRSEHSDAMVVNFDTVFTSMNVNITPGSMISPKLLEKNGEFQGFSFVGDSFN